MYGMLIALLLFLCVILVGYAVGALFKKNILIREPGPFTKIMRLIAEFSFVCLLPGIGIATTDNRCEEHPFEIESLPTTYVLWGLFALAYIISRAFKEKLSPLVLIFVTSGLVAGWLFCLVICVHFLKMFPIMLFPGFNLLYMSPFFCFFFLLKEIRTINKLFLSRLLAKEVEGTEKNSAVKVLHRYPIIISSVLTAPFFAMVQALLYLLGQKPDSLISQFTDSCGFLLSHSQSCGCGGDHYLCSIAANGNKELVKPTRMGWRQNQKILVNRQLLIANAFENWLEEHTPRLHRFVRRTYDSMNIPVNEWSKRRRFANVLYLLMKPLEWLFLLWLYLFDKQPENRIARQYLPQRELNQFLKIKSDEKLN